MLANMPTLLVLTYTHLLQCQGRRNRGGARGGPCPPIICTNMRYCSLQRSVILKKLCVPPQSVKKFMCAPPPPPQSVIASYGPECIWKTGLYNRGQIFKIIQVWTVFLVKNVMPFIL